MAGGDIYVEQMLVSGTVTDSVTSDPIEAVVVVFPVGDPDPRIGTTNALGQYSLGIFGCVSGLLGAIKTGYEINQKQIDPSCNAVNTEDISLVAEVIVLDGGEAGGHSQIVPPSGTPLFDPVASETLYGGQTPKASKDTATGQLTGKKGLVFPLGDRNSGPNLAISSGKDLVRNKLKQLLSTEKGERVMLPNYGINIKRFLFQPLDTVTFEEIKEEILTGLNNYAPDVEVLKLSVFPSTKASARGLPEIDIILSVKIKQSVDQPFDVKVTVGA